MSIICMLLEVISGTSRGEENGYEKMVVTISSNAVTAWLLLLYNNICTVSVKNIRSW